MTNRAAGETCDDGKQCTDGTPCGYGTIPASVCAGIGDGSCLPRSGDGCDQSCGRTPSCIGTPTQGAILCPGDDTGLLVDTPISFGDSCGAAKCEYTCDPPNSVRSGTICVPTCGGWLFDQGYSDVGTGCCSRGCAGRGASGVSYDCNYCCESFSGVGACR